MDNKFQLPVLLKDLSCNYLFTSEDFFQVVSGCSWGNILVWAEGRVEIEACLRNGEACHNSPIINFIYNQQIDEICTVGNIFNDIYFQYNCVLQTFKNGTHIL